MTSTDSSGIPLGGLLPGFRRHLKAKRRSDRTIHLYDGAGQRLVQAGEVNRIWEQYAP